MHISGAFECAKVDIQSAKVDIQSAKVDIQEKLLAFSSKISDKTVNYAYIWTWKGKISFSIN